MTAANGLRVLVVEDNPLNAELTTALLESEGHEVELVCDGGSLRRREGGPPDVVLMDIQLPDADGVTLLGELRGDPRYGGVAVIAVTAHALHGDNERLIAAGFDGVITKPLATRTFCAEVARCVRQRRRR